MNRKSKTINLIQDRATPHNNVLISEFKKNTDVKLNVWYAEDQDIGILLDIGIAIRIRVISYMISQVMQTTV